MRHSGYFDTWTRDAADGQQRPLILDGYRTHYSLDFIRYAVQNKITLLSYPKHTTHPRQLLDVVLFAPLQQACGTAVHTHTCEARTGTTKKVFFGFYSQEKRIKSLERISKQLGVRSWNPALNPDAILQPLPQMLEQSRGPRKSSDGRHVQRPTSTPSKFLAWQMPRNRRQLRHQTNAAIDILSKTVASARDLIRKLSQKTEGHLREQKLQK